MAYVGNQPFGKTVRTTTSETLTSVKTQFYPSGGYTIGYVDVYLNGSKLAEVSDYTATNGSLVTLLFNPEIGDTVEIITYGSVEIANAVRRSGDTMTGNLTINANLVVNGTTSISGSGASLTALNATNISSGTLATPRLPAGTVLQVLQAVKSDTQSTSSATFGDITGLSVSITPTSASSKILVSASISRGTDSNQISNFRFMRDATAIGIGDTAGSRTRSTMSVYTGNADAVSHIVTITMNFLDSPATTSATTYKVQFSSQQAAAITYINRNASDGDASTVSRTTSTFTVMEIAA